MSHVDSKPVQPLSNEELVDRILAMDESLSFDTKCLGNNRRNIETIVALANKEGGLLVLGVEDKTKASGRDRLYGIQENPESLDELHRLLPHRITPPLAEPNTPPPKFVEVKCKLRDGRPGSIMIVRVQKSSAVHSVVDGGTFIRLEKSNRQLSAAEITELSMQRGEEFPHAGQLGGRAKAKRCWRSGGPAGGRDVRHGDPKRTR
jgi:ATP-dependent DNA helicase RecG